MLIPTGYLPTLYDFHFDVKQEKWIPWSSLVPKYNHDPEIRFSSILGNDGHCGVQALLLFLIEMKLLFAYSPLVPTTDTTRMSWLLEQMVKIERPVLLVGDSGTSKTATIHSFLKNLNGDTMVRHQHQLELERVSFKFPRPLTPCALGFYKIKAFNCDTIYSNHTRTKTSILPSLALTEATVIMLVFAFVFF